MPASVSFCTFGEECHSSVPATRIATISPPNFWRTSTTCSSSRRIFSIRIFLADGTPEGLRLVEKSNWTGLGIVCPRSQYSDARKRSEFGRPGVYVLVGPGESGLPQVYIGEAEELRSRLDNHQQNKDFWTRVVAFTSKDGNINKAHVRYLESRLTGLANVAKRAEVANGNAPALPALSEPDAADVENFLREMLAIFPVLEITAFQLSGVSAKATSPSGSGGTCRRGSSSHRSADRGCRVRHARGIHR